MADHWYELDVTVRDKDGSHTISREYKSEQETPGEAGQEIMGALPNEIKDRFYGVAKGR